MNDLLFKLQSLMTNPLDADEVFQKGIASFSKTGSILELIELVYWQGVQDGADPGHD